MTDLSNRGRRAEYLLVAYAALGRRMAEAFGKRGTEALIRDLLADFMHYAVGINIDFEKCLRMAAEQFKKELSSKGDRS